jgi:hypothetical protein
MKALSYPSSRNPFILFTASSGLAAAAGPGWQISTGGAAEHRSANVDRVGLRIATESVSFQVLILVVGALVNIKLNHE